jgi:hypothetical protein
MIVERSLRETKMKTSVDLEGLERLVAVSRVLKEGQAEVRMIEERMQSLVEEVGKIDRMVSANNRCAMTGLTRLKSLRWPEQG